MRHIDTNLLSGELLVFRTRPHWIVCAKPFFIILFFTAVIGVGGKYISRLQPNLLSRLHLESESSMLALTLLLLAVVVPILISRSTDCMVTNQRVIITTRLWNNKPMYLSLNRVESVRVEQSFIGGILNYGNVVIHEAGGAQESIDRIAKAREFQREIQEQIKAAGVQRPG